ncbi:MAG TPA: hypothetical protein VFZ20_17715, partial [Longimicrobium sp.]
NNGRTFSSMYNQPTAELYDVVTDNQVPYRLYGSQQDNTSIGVPSRRLENTLRPQQEWTFAAGCETGPVALHPDHPETIWGGCYGGNLNRMHVPTDTRVSVSVYPENTAVAPRDMINRWQWIAPAVVSPHDPRTLYYASQYLYRSRDGGDRWERISPDLTTNDTTLQRWPGGPITPDHTGAEVFTTIFAVAPSPHDARTLWVGTDDGRVHVTRDEGGTWTDVTPPGMPRLGTVSRIDVSPHAPGRAFVAVHRYRMDDFAPYVFATDDFGRTWRRLADGTNGIPADHPVRVVREDPARRGLLYAGTEFGLFVSFDDGARWQPLRLNLPATPVMDIKVHRGDLVLATQGRSFWVLDDLTPLRELAADARAGTVRLYTPRPAARGVVGPPLQEVDLVLPDDLPHGALIHYALPADVPEVRMDVLDANGRTVRAFHSDSVQAERLGTRRLRAARGFHRVVWDLRGAGPRSLSETGEARGWMGGVKMPPGDYRVRLTVGGDTTSHPLVVTGDPRDPSITRADYEAQHALSSAVRDTIEQMNGRLAALASVDARARALVRQADSTGAASPALRAAADTLLARTARARALLVPAQAPGDLGTPAGLMAQFGTLYGTLVGDGGYGAGSAEGRPTEARYRRAADLDAQWTAIRPRLDGVLADEVARFNEAARTLGLPPIESVPGR